MVEVAGNLHIHTPYSDGEKYHYDIAEAAIAAGLDFIVVTDHNVWVDGIERYVENEQGRVLLLVGEEIHDARREPQGNHLLVYGAERELAMHAAEPQQLIDQVSDAGGICFLAHPSDTFYPWHSWNLEGYAGLELWNYMSSFLEALNSLVGGRFRDTPINRLRALPAAFNPERYITAPAPATLRRWDELLAAGQRVAVVGNSDVHGTPMNVGPIHREIFPYEFCFRAVNTHLLLEDGLSGDVAVDKQRIYAALAQGRGWVGYDMPRSTRGFRFFAADCVPGDELPLAEVDVLRVHAPAAVDMRIIRHGEIVAAARETTMLTYEPQRAGAYRVECSIAYKNKQRGWIYSNAIYLT